MIDEEEWESFARKVKVYTFDDRGDAVRTVVRDREVAINANNAEGADCSFDPSDTGRLLRQVSAAVSHLAAQRGHLRRDAFVLAKRGLNSCPECGRSRPGQGR